MSKLVEEILNKNYEMANEALTEQFRTILERKMCEMKKMTSAKMTEMSHEERQKRLKMDVIEEEDPHEMRLAPVSADNSASPERLKKLDTMASSKPAPAAAPTSADKQSAANLEEQNEPGEESSMARSELSAIAKNVKTIMSKIRGHKELEAWTQSKITKSADYLSSVADYMDSKEGQLEEARINLVKARIRGGVVQRRKKVSNVPGMTIRGGQLKRMSAAERRRRKLGAKKAQLKTRGKQIQIQRNRKLSLMKRKRLGL